MAATRPTTHVEIVNSILRSGRARALNTRVSSTREDLRRKVAARNREFTRMKVARGRFANSRERKETDETRCKRDPGDERLTMTQHACSNDNWKTRDTVSFLRDFSKLNLYLRYFAFGMYPRIIKSDVFPCQFPVIQISIVQEVFPNPFKVKYNSS